MSFAGKLVRGLAAGLGSYYTQKGLLEVEQRKQEALSQREMALRKFQQGIDNENADRDVVRRERLAQHQSALDRGKMTQEMRLRSEAAAADDARDFGSKKELQTLDHIQKLKELQTQHGYDLPRDQQASVLRMQEKAAADGLAIDRFETDQKTGTLVGISSKTGRIFRSDIKPVPKATGDYFSGNVGATNWPDRPSATSAPKQTGSDVPVISGSDAQIEAAIGKLPKGAVFIVDGQRYKK